MGKKLLLSLTVFVSVFLTTRIITIRFLSQALEDQRNKICQLAAEYQFLPEEFELQIPEQTTLENIQNLEATVADLEGLIQANDPSAEILHSELEKYLEALRSAKERYQNYLRYRTDCTRLTEEYQAKYGK